MKRALFNIRNNCIKASQKPAAKAKREEAQRLAILSGKYNPSLNYKKTKKIVMSIKAGSIVCQSSWEEVYCKLLDHDPDVLTFSKDKIRLPYIFNGKNRVYIVDFLVTYLTRPQTLVEIKPSVLLDKDENPAKFNAARNWCFDRQIKFKILTEKELFPKKIIDAAIGG